MHQRKLHLLALYENDLLAPRLNDTLSLGVRANKPSVHQHRVCLPEAQLLYIFCLGPSLPSVYNEALFKGESGAGYLSRASVFLSIACKRFPR